jgi:hypothetical protein
MNVDVGGQGRWVEHVAPDDVVHADDNTVMMDVETGTAHA